MSFTFEDYVNSIKALIPISENYPSSYFQIAIREARLELANFFDPKISFYSFLIDNPEIDLTVKTGLSIDSILKVMTVVIKQSSLSYEINRGFKEDIPFENIVGYPIFYYLQGKMMGFYPKPTSNLYAEIKISIKPSILLPGQTDYDFPEYYEPLISILASHYVALIGGNANLAAFFRSLYDRQKSMIKRTML